ncbi:hypothetical protein MKEN_01208700 [Mycena kentingensis (nom. inval.)]|nr:hypothetical protein MKEN_01208700 [Mycena kentingensis (nom. inval.)]
MAVRDSIALEGLMDRPRAHSTVARQTQSTFHVRASRLFHRVSSKFSRTQQDPSVSAAKDPSYTGPYMRHTSSLDDRFAKPYLSQPMLLLDNADSDGSESPVRSETENVSLPRASPRPPRPLRAPPPPPQIPPAKPPNLSLNADPPALQLPTVTPPTPTSPPTTVLTADAAQEQLPTRRDSLPPLRRARSQTLADGRNWSRPTSVIFSASAQVAAGLGAAIAFGGSATGSRPGSYHPVASSAEVPERLTATLSVSTISTTSSYATAGSTISTTSTLNGLPVLDRREAPSGLPPAELPSPDTVVDGLPPGAAPAADPHHFSPVSPQIPSAKIQNGLDARRASVSSFASATSIDSFATARSNGWSEDEVQGDEEAEDDDEEGGLTPTVGDEESKDLVMPLGRQDTLRQDARERAETLRGVGNVVLNSPTSSRILGDPATPTTSNGGWGSPVLSSPASSSTVTPTNSRVTPSSPTSTLTPSPPATPKIPFSPRAPMRATSLPPISTLPLVIPAAPVPSIPPPSSVLVDTSPSDSTFASPWGSHGLAPSPRTRTASGGYTPSPTTVRSMTGTLPSRRPPSIPMSMHRFSMTFNPGAPLSPGSDLGRLSPSIIVRQPPLAIPVLRLPSVTSPALPPSPVSPETVTRRSSVIFGPHGTNGHEREPSRAVVRSMPALAMEGPAEDGPDAGESDSENEDDLLGAEDDGEDDEDDDSRRPSMDTRTSGETDESPFVPLRLDTTSLSLELGVGLGLSSPIARIGKGKEREIMAPLPINAQASQSSTKTITLQGKTPMAQMQPRNGDYFSMLRSPSSDARTPMPSSPIIVSRTVTMPPMPIGERPKMYKHASRSMVDIVALQPEPEATEDDRGEAPAYDGHGIQRSSTLKRRRSMPEVSAAPPPYTAPIFPVALENGISLHPLAQIKVVPREDEGKEILPPYTNSILLRSVMPRKMEFSEPGVQAKDRKWRRCLCELEGTVFRVYKCAGEGWWERRVGVGDITGQHAGVAAANAAAAIKARAAAKEDAEQVKLAGEEGRLPDIADEGTTEVALGPRSSVSSSRSRASSSVSLQQPSSASSIADMASQPASRSRLNLGLSLLKPRSHGRSKSDLPNSPRTPTTPRTSFSLSRSSLGANPSPTASTSGAALAPSRSNASLASSRSGMLSSRTPATPATPSSTKGKQRAASVGPDIPEPDPQDLIRAYTMQHAESGLGNDYVKRKHVIRVRMEGEQFLLQARDVADVVDWIEGLHCATNIALDLDERPMPKGPLFPRRRRRRNRPAAGATPAAGTSSSNNEPAEPARSAL